MIRRGQQIAKRLGGDLLIVSFQQRNKRLSKEEQILKQKGIDVIVGLLETHGRKEILEQVGELEVIPRKTVSYKSTILEEMDTEAIIERNPEVVLVDELAHTNVLGSEKKKAV